jgi:putative transcriptional regulator
MLNEQMRERRRAKGMTQLQLAVAAGLSIAGVQAVEAGDKRPSIDTCHAIARALGTTVDALWPVEPAPVVVAGQGGGQNPEPA